MRACSNARDPRCLPGLACALVAACLTLGAARAQEDPARAFRVLHAETRLERGVYLLNARFDLNLTEPPRRALQSGVPLYIDFEIRVTRERNWWMDETVASLVQRYRLEYHALSRSYLTVNLNTGERRSFRSMARALGYVGELVDFPLLDRVLVGEQWRYLGFVRALLDLGRLPLPLVPGAYLNADWRLQSEEYQWLLN